MGIDRFTKELGKVTLEEAMSVVSQRDNLSNAKEDSMIFVNGYQSTSDKYPRKEAYLDRIGSIFIDCDNSRNDKDIITKFKEQYKDYEYYIYETFSSSMEKPKFRAIIPLDAEIGFSSSVKHAIFNTFRLYADDAASWFFVPTLNKIETISHHDGKPFPARVIEKAAKEIEVYESQRKLEMEISRQLFLIQNAGKTPSEDGWRKFKAVKKCLEGLVEGERDNSLNAACWVMEQYGFKDKIPQFLDEVDCELALKNKFRRQYR